MSDRTVVDFLADVPLLAGSDEAALTELSRVMRRRTVRKGELLWRQGDVAREMVFIVEGSVAVQLEVVGDRTVEIGRAGPGDTAGEIGLLDGRGHSMSAHATETTTILTLGQLDFQDLLAGQDAAAFRRKRQLASLFTARVRNQLGHTAGALGGSPAGPSAEAVSEGAAQLENSRAPDSAYVRRMASFHDFDPLALWGFLTSGRYVQCPAGVPLLGEGVHSDAYYLTINGAVEKVLVRNHRRLRVGLAGPGKAFGYEGLIDGLPSPVTAITRERSLLLVIPRELFRQLFNGEAPVSRGFLNVIEHDLTAGLRESLLPCARLAAGT